MQYRSECSQVAPLREPLARNVRLPLAFVPYGTYCSNMHYPTEAQVMEYINDARQGQGLSINAFASLAGLSARTVSAKLAGERPARITDLYRFAVALGTSPARIYAALDDA